MADSLYNVVFRGELVGGADPAVVKQNLAKLFKMDAARVEKLFSGKPVVLKKNADKATAMKFRAVLKKAGAQCEMKPVEEAGESPSPAQEQPSAKPRANFEARDPETRPLSEEAEEAERRRQQEAAEQAEAAENGEEPAAGQPGAAEGSEEPIAGEPAGDDGPESTGGNWWDQDDGEVEEIEAAPPPEPAPESAPEPAGESTPKPAAAHADSAPPADSELVGTIRMGGTGFSDEFDVAPAGSDIGDHHEDKDPVNPDISHLSLAPAGSDLEELPRNKPVDVPDISHLKVLPPETPKREDESS